MSKAIVIGSGIAGIATALRLRAQGRDVHVFESNAYPGGKLTEIRNKGYRFDAGPSLFTMPKLIDELFLLFGENPRDHFNYDALDVSCNYFYADGTNWECPSDPLKLSETIEKMHGEHSEDVKGFLMKSARMYQLTSPVFLENSLHKASTYFSKSGIKGIFNLWRLNMFSSMNSMNSKTFKDPRTVQFFNRYATYNGSNPFQAPATLNVIPHLEYGMGTFFPKKGMHDITLSLYELALRHGIVFKFDTRVESIIIENSKAAGVRTRTGNYYADIVVSNMDIYHTYGKLLKGEEMPSKVKNVETSSSALIFYWGVNRSFHQFGLHNVCFSADYSKEFEDIFKRGTISDDPTVYCNITSKMKQDDAPEGCENWFVMINVPGNTGQDWDALIEYSRKNIIRKLSAILGTDISQHIETEDILDPRSIEARTSSYRGALYGSSSNSVLSAFFRHPNFKSDIKDLYFCGGSVHPGGGIPLCLRSAEIVGKLVESSGIR